jgi:hypothetical protein
MTGRKNHNIPAEMKEFESDSRYVRLTYEDVIKLDKRWMKEEKFRTMVGLVKTGILLAWLDQETGEVRYLTNTTNKEELKKQSKEHEDEIMNVAKDIRRKEKRKRKLKKRK